MSFPLMHVIETRFTVEVVADALADLSAVEVVALSFFAG